MFLKSVFEVWQDYKVYFFDFIEYFDVLFFLFVGYEDNFFFVDYKENFRGGIGYYQVVKEVCYFFMLRKWCVGFELLVGEFFFFCSVSINREFLFMNFVFFIFYNKCYRYKRYL